MPAEFGHAPNRMYVSRNGNIHTNGSKFYDANENDLLLHPCTATVSPAASTSNICLVTFQLLDGNGAALTGPTNIVVHLSDAATGVGLTGTTASGAVAAGASGTDLSAMVAKKAIHAQTDATGKYILSITDSAKTGFYPVVTIPGLKAIVGAQLVTANYG